MTGRAPSPGEPQPRPGGEPASPDADTGSPDDDSRSQSEPWGREAVAEFLLRLRGRGVRDLAVLRAIEGVPRQNFVPDRFRGLAGKDIALPLPCGQTMSEPIAVARAIEALRVSPECRVLEIGPGSGYATAILARLCREVLAVERFRSLVVEARTRLAALESTGVTVIWGDGLAIPVDRGPFDRVLVHAEMPGFPASLSSVLADDGVAVYARAGQGGEAARQWLVRAERDQSGAWVELPLAPSRLRPLLPGSSREL